MLTIVTAIYGPRFKLYEPEERWPNCRFLCVTDRADFAPAAWKIRHHPMRLSPRRSNRAIKALIHYFVSGPTLYIDAEFKLVDNPHDIVMAALEGHSWAATRHPARNCLFDEGAACLRKRITESPEALRLQMERYETEGMPRNAGLWAGGIIARSGDKASRKLGEEWWGEIADGSERDQIALPYVARKLNLPPGVVPGTYTALPWLARRKL